MVYDIIVQAIGILAVVCFILSFQIKSNKALFICQMAGSILFCIQFFIMGAFTGCINYFASIVRNLMLSKMDKYEKFQWRGWAYIFSLISVITLIFTWKDAASLLPTIAFIVGSFGLWTNNAQKIRFFNLIAVSPCYLAYGIYVGSIGAILNEVFILASISLSIYRYGWKAMSENKFD